MEFVYALVRDGATGRGRGEHFGGEGGNRQEGAASGALLWTVGGPCGCGLMETSVKSAFLNGFAQGLGGGILSKSPKVGSGRPDGEGGLGGVRARV